MNSLITENGDMLTGTHAMRNGLLANLSDAELAFNITGNPTLGVLFREMGEVQQSYIDSFKNLSQDFTYRHADPSVETNVAALSAWYEQLDAALLEALGAFSEEEVQSKTIDRNGFSPSLAVQVQIYMQALLIFYGKVTIYFRAMGKDLGEQWKEWIG
jgi:hypothetical protein